MFEVSIVKSWLYVPYSSYNLHTGFFLIKYSYSNLNVFLLSIVSYFIFNKTLNSGYWFKVDSSSFNVSPLLGECKIRIIPLLSQVIFLENHNSTLMHIQFHFGRYFTLIFPVKRIFSSNYKGYENNSHAMIKLCKWGGIGFTMSFFRYFRYMLIIFEL